MCPKTEKDFIPRVCEKLSAERCHVSMMSWRDGMDEKDRKGMAANCCDRDVESRKSIFVLDPHLHWKPVECSEQQCCFHMPGLWRISQAA